MILQAAGGSDLGRRRLANEDRYALAPDLGLYVVADGMGGHKAGQVASQLAAEAVLRTAGGLEEASVGVTEKLRCAVSAANSEIFQAARAREEFAGMGTTLVALLLVEGCAALAHVGDSRAYQVRRGRIRQLTNDHSLVGELVRRREISAEAARSHPHRHVLTRALGVRATVEADLVEVAPAQGDVFVLCSDGLTGHVRDEEIARAVAAEVDLQAAVDGLIALANDRGGEDNVTVVLVRCEKERDGERGSSAGPGTKAG